MSTQVSWIEPDQLRDLVGQLQGSAGDADRSAWEVHTLPGQMGLGAKDLGIPDDDLWLPTEFSPATEPGMETAEAFFRTEVPPDPQPEAAPEPESLAAEVSEEEIDDVDLDERSSPPSTTNEPPVELNRIRQKLQAIRERAIQAGLLAYLPSDEVSPPPATPTEPPASKLESPLPEVPVFLDGPDPIGDTGPLEHDQVPSLSVPDVRISSPFSLADGPDVDPSPAEAASSAFIVPSGPIMQRLDAFAQWACGLLHTRELLIADDHGDVLWGEHSQSGLIVSTMMASKAALRSTALGACDPLSLIEQPISIGRIMVVVPCETRFGTLSVALIRGFSLSASDAVLLRRNIVKALDGSDGVSSGAPENQGH